MQTYIGGYLCWENPFQAKGGQGVMNIVLLPADTICMPTYWHTMEPVANGLKNNGVSFSLADLAKLYFEWRPQSIVQAAHHTI